MSNSQQLHGPQPTRLLHPWDFPGKSTGVGCHCLLCSLVLVGDKTMILPLFPFLTEEYKSDAQEAKELEC